MKKTPPLNLDTFKWGVRAVLHFQLPPKVHNKNGKILMPVNVEVDPLQQNQEHDTEEKHEDLKELKDDQPKKNGNKRKSERKLELIFKLTKQEIKYDFIAATGRNPPRRRRPNSDPLFPGWSQPRFSTMDRYGFHQ